MVIDYLGEGKLHDRLQRELVRDAAHDEFIIEYRQNMFNEDTLNEWLEKKKVEAPHRFVGGAERDKADDLARSAFLYGNATDQARYQKIYGPEGALLAAQRFGNKFPFVIGQPGKESDADRAANNEKDNWRGPGSKNPWSGEPGHVFTKEEMTAQNDFLKVLLKAHKRDEALRRANQVAGKYNCVVGSTRVGQRLSA
jgi:hypothetical protein